ncbi:E3 ubiquitin- ligase RNF185 isoform X1 [Chlorella sorokiniana]|uniref:RING-type E3 ubiquitin transferase n=1 Tax=Chlorella sorokiniana TaxID=3076 RepID=A0A2P6U2E2_CHLSO|nr:E3 ubiquitin- ligase RNF185 isoform X1 [Chlorella sorokiniana]|eukprot:PRW60485.1 E3 ubiquitin- ligase RNF185 isoform X1 [Chlorella sorokiniana]
MSSAVESPLAAQPLPALQPEAGVPPQPAAEAKQQQGLEEDVKASLKKLESFEAEETMFSCNICYELASEPVVTLCGHLYCWPCLYRWLQVQSHCRTCPVCKAGVEKDKVIPIYGRGGNEDPRSKSKGELEAVPQRPAGQRPAPIVRNPLLQPNVNVNAQQGGLGIIPTLFGLQNSNGNGGYAEPLTPEQQHQAFLSRLLLMLGSFVIMCLLLF